MELKEAKEELKKDLDNFKLNESLIFFSSGKLEGRIIKKKYDAIETVLQALKEKEEINESHQKENGKLQVELTKKDKIINDAITRIENLKEYFSEDCQVDFILLLEILKDEKVIDW